MEHVNAEAGGCGGSRCTEVFAGGAESCGPATKRCSDSPDPARFSLSVTEGHHGHQRVQVANVRLGGGGGFSQRDAVHEAGGEHRPRARPLSLGHVTPAAPRGPRTVPLPLPPKATPSLPSQWPSPSGWHSTARP